MLSFMPECCVSSLTAQHFAPLSEPGRITCIDSVVRRQGCNCSAPVGKALKISTFSNYRSARTPAALHQLRGGEEG